MERTPDRVATLGSVTLWGLLLLRLVTLHAVQSDPPAGPAPASESEARIVGPVR